jgi:hypothetical protein
MKKIISILILGFCCFNIAKAQAQPKILISYDENGNRILRAYVPYRPAPPQQPKATDSILITGESKNKDMVATGLTAVTENNLKVYPNPSNDNFNVVVSEGILNANAELVLIDQLGREHKRTKIKSITTTISTKRMADGVYSIIVQYGNNKSTTKVVKKTD